MKAIAGRAGISREIPARIEDYHKMLRDAWQATGKFQRVIADETGIGVRQLINYMGGYTLPSWPIVNILACYYGRDGGVLFPPGVTRETVGRIDYPKILLEARHATGKGQRVVARETGIGTRQLYNYEAGFCLPSWPILHILARCYGLDKGAFFPEAEKQKEVAP